MQPTTEHEPDQPPKTPSVLVSACAALLTILLTTAFGTYVGYLGHGYTWQHFLSDEVQAGRVTCMIIGGACAGVILFIILQRMRACEAIDHFALTALILFAAGLGWWIGGHLSFWFYYGDS